MAAGALTGESALYAPVVRQVEARVAEDAVVAAISRETFRRVLAEFPAAADKVRVALADAPSGWSRGSTPRGIRSLDTVGRKPGAAP